MRRLAIVPARGGSKRIPNKNTRDFCGRPMMGHVLAAARDSGLFSTIHVSTDSDLIADTAAILGFPVDFMRPDELADDHTAIMPVLRYVAAEYQRRGEPFDQVWMLMACAPLIAASDLVGAEKLFADNGGTLPLLAVAEYPVPVEWAYRREAGGRLVPAQPGMFALRSQDIEKKYFDAGAFSIFPASYVQQSHGAGSDADFIGYELSRGSSVDIDSDQDWALAEAIYASQTCKARKAGTL